MSKIVPSPRWAPTEAHRPVILAHRGASAHAPENSLEAFSRAARDGADGVELDVLCCASGEVVVFHDDDLWRLGGRPEQVANLSLKALRAVTLRGGVGIPTLEEAFAACGPELLVNVELKTSGLLDRRIGFLVDQVAQVVDRTHMHERVLVSSFNPRALWAWKRRHPVVRAALLFEKNAPLPLRQAWSRPLIHPFALHPEEVLCNPRSVQRWHQEGYVVNSWTVDDPQRLRALRDAGVDGLICNDPAAARAALAEGA